MSKFIAFVLRSLCLTTYGEVDIMEPNPICLLHDDAKFKPAVKEKPRQIPDNLNCHKMKCVPTT